MENKFSKMMGFTLIKQEKDEVILELKVKEEHLNVFNAVHGGTLFSLCDEASGYMALQYYKRPVTLNTSFNYLRPALNTEKLVCKVHCIKVGKTVLVVEANVFDQNDVQLSFGIITLMETIK